MLALGEKRERRKAASPQAKLSLLPLELHLLKQRLSFLPPHGNLSGELPTDSSTHGLYPLDTLFLVVNTIPSHPAQQPGMGPVPSGWEPLPSVSIR